MANLHFLIGVACLISVCSGANPTRPRRESDVEELHTKPIKVNTKEETVNIDEDNPLKVFLHRTKETMDKGYFVGLEGKNVAGMMAKIEGILKEGVKHTVPVETHKSQDRPVLKTFSLFSDAQAGGAHGGGAHGGIALGGGAHGGGAHGGGAHGSGYVPTKGMHFPGDSGESQHHERISPAENTQNFNYKVYQPIYSYIKKNALKHKDTNLYDLKNIWLLILDDVYQILQDKNIRKDVGTDYEEYGT